MAADTTAHLDDDRCAELALSLLSGDDRRDALAHAAACEPCAVRLRSHVAAAVRATADVPAARRAAAAPARLPAPASRPSGRRARLAWRMLPAAAAIALASLLLPRGTAPPRGGEGPWLPAPVEALVPRGESPLDPHLAAGFEAYARRDLATVARELGAVRAQGGAEQARRLYLAHAQLARGEHDAALALLRSVAFEELPLAVAREALALLVRALRAAGETAEADSLERRLRETPAWVPVRP